MNKPAPISPRGALRLKQSRCKHDKLKAKKVGNPMIYDCMKCGKVIKSKKQK